MPVPTLCYRTHRPRQARGHGLRIEILNDWKKRFSEIFIQQKTHRSSLRRNRQRPSFALSGISEASQDIFMGELRESGNDLWFRRANRKVAEDVTDCDPGATYTGFAETDVRVDAYVGVEQHRAIVVLPAVAIQRDVIGTQVGRSRMVGKNHGS